MRKRLPGDGPGAGHTDGSSVARRRSRQLKQGAAGPRHAEVRLATTALVLAEKGGQAPTLATRMPLRGGSAALQYPRPACTVVRAAAAGHQDMG